MGHDAAGRLQGLVFLSLLLASHRRLPLSPRPVGLSQQMVGTEQGAARGLCTLPFMPVASLHSGYCCSLVRRETNKTEEVGHVSEAMGRACPAPAPQHGVPTPARGSPCWAATFAAPGSAGRAGSPDWWSETARSLTRLS